MLKVLAKVYMEIVHVHVRYVMQPNVRGVSLQPCHAHLSLFRGVATMWTSVVCSKGDLDIFPRRVCLMGQCPDCGVEKLQLCPNEIATERYVQLWCIGYVAVGKNSNGQNKKVLRVEYKR